MRLRVLCVSVVFLLTCMARAEDSSKWEARESVSEMDDSKTLTLSLKAEGSITGWPGKSETPTLMLRCRPKTRRFAGEKFSAYVVTGFPAQVKTGGYYKAVSLRFDKQKPELSGWEETDTKDGFFFSGPEKIARKILEHESMLVSFIPFNSTEQVASFDVRGLAQVIGPIKEACGLK